MDDVEFPPQVDMKIAELVDDDEFETRAEAIEQLVSAGLRAYETNGTDNDDEFGIGEGPMYENRSQFEDDYAF